MKRSIVETALGAVVLMVAGFFLVFSLNTAQVGKVNGYEISANFSSIGGLAVGDDVMISGVKVGSVSGLKLDSDTYLANVKMMLDPAIKLPLDTAALISSESLLGGKYLALEPGGEEDMMNPGDVINITQSPQNLEQLLGKFIFSMQDGKKQQEEAPADDPAPDTIPMMPPAPLSIPTPSEGYPSAVTDEQVP